MTLSNIYFCTIDFTSKWVKSFCALSVRTEEICELNLDDHIKSMNIIDLF